MAYVGLLLAVVLDNALRLLVPLWLGFEMTLPSLPLLTALYIGFRARRSSHLGYAVVLGLLVDCFSTCPLGHFGFVYGASAYVAWRIRRYLPSDSMLSDAVGTLLVGLVAAGFAALLAVLTPRGSAGIGFGAACLTAVASALVAPAVFGFLEHSRLFRGIFGRRRSYYEFVR